MIQELYNQISSKMDEIDLQEEADLFIGHYNIRSYITSARYYKALAAYCMLKSPKNVLELGTCSGASAACLSKYASKVLTIDVDFRHVHNSEVLESRGIVFKKVSPEETVNVDFVGHDLVFIDIDHTGLKETVLHNRLKESYKGYVFWDDVQSNAGMRKFWDGIDRPKIATDWHGSGFGIVQY